MASTTEPKGEIQEVTEEVLTETLSYKTWVLKISIHCAACSKKVTKILKKIDGVYLTQVDFVQQRVTVIGNVEAETLIKQLSKKTTKHVELLWPEPKANSTSNDKAKKQSKPKSDEKQGDQAAISEEPKANHAGGDKKKGKELVKDEVVEAVGSGVGNKKFEVGSSSNSKGIVEEVEVVKPHEGGGGVGGKGKEAQPVAVEKERVGVESEKMGEQSGGGSKKKGKGHKGNENVNAEGEVVGDDAPPVQPGPQPRPQPQRQPQPRPYGPQNVHSAMPNVLRPVQGPPPQQVYEQPYYARQQQFDQYPYPRQQQQHFAAVHAMNYHAAHPVISYGAARYATTPAYSQTHTYAHWGLGNEVEPRDDHLDNLHVPLPPSLPATQFYPPHPYDTSNSDNYAFFSDENPNGCSVM